MTQLTNNSVFVPIKSSITNMSMIVELLSYATNVLLCRRHQLAGNLEIASLYNKAAKDQASTFGLNDIAISILDSRIVAENDPFNPNHVIDTPFGIIKRHLKK